MFWENRRTMIKTKNFETKFWDRIRRQSTSSVFTVNIERTRKRAIYHWKYPIFSFLDHLFDRQTEVRLWNIDIASWRRIKLLSCRDSSDHSRCKWETVGKNKSFQSGNLSSAYASSLEMKLFWLIICCPIGVKLVPTNRGHIGLYSDRRDQKVNERVQSWCFRAVKVIWCFLRFLQNLWQRWGSIL